MAQSPVRYRFTGAVPSRSSVRSDIAPLAAIASAELRAADYPAPPLEFVVRPEVPDIVRGRTERTDGGLRVTLFVGGVPRTQRRLTIAHELRHVQEIAVLGSGGPQTGWAGWADRLGSEFLAERGSERLRRQAFGPALDTGGPDRAAGWLLQVGLSSDQLAGIAKIAVGPDPQAATSARSSLNEAVCELFILFACAAGALSGDGLASEGVFVFPGLPAEPPITAAAQAVLSPILTATAGLPLLPNLADYGMLTSVRNQTVERLRKTTVAIGAVLLAQAGSAFA